jgi:hypothetical protein
VDALRQPEPDRERLELGTAGPVTDDDEVRVWVLVRDRGERLDRTMPSSGASAGIENSARTDSSLGAGTSSGSIALRIVVTRSGGTPMAIT